MILGGTALIAFGIYFMFAFRDSDESATMDSFMFIRTGLIGIVLNAIAPEYRNSIFVGTWISMVIQWLAFYNNRLRN
jgi:hypothetical protein